MKLSSNDKRLAQTVLSQKPHFYAFRTLGQDLRAGSPATAPEQKAPSLGPARRARIRRHSGSQV